MALPNSEASLPSKGPSNSNIGVFQEMLAASLEQTETRLNQVKTTTELKQKLARISACEDGLRESQAMRRSFMMELQLLAKPQDRDPYRALLEGYDKRLANVDSQLKWEKTAAEKSALTGGSKAGGPPGARGPNGEIIDPEDPTNTVDGLMKETNSIQLKTTNVLDRTRKRAAEARDIGKEVADTLNGQTEQINRIDEGVTNLDSEVARANQILGAIARRMATDKLVMCFLFVLIAVIIGVIVIVTIDPKGPTSSAKTPLPPGA